jgi:hypothetical protein
MTFDSAMVSGHAVGSQVMERHFMSKFTECSGLHLLGN